jgi:murein L,D-transpeptidase YcbB/YkuD
MPPAQAESPAQVQSRLEAEGGILHVGERWVDLSQLREIYRQRGYRLMWTGASEALADDLMLDLQTMAVAEGLVADAYAIPATGSDLDHDLMITDALLRFGRDLAAGRVAPSRAFGGLGAETRPAFDRMAFLRLLSSRPAFAAATQPLLPAYAGYTRLRDALHRYRHLARTGGWPRIPEGASIKPGMADDRVTLVRTRLIVTGELSADLAGGTLLDPPLTEALKRFQARHGLDEDGAVGPQTLLALNVPIEERLRQMVLNLERWRWMPRLLASHHVAVNVAAATLDLIENGTPAMSMRVVVGDTKHPTPTFTAPMSSLVLNPPWTVPPSIATKEVLPKLRRDRNYLASQNLRITAFPVDSPEAVGEGVDWDQVAAGGAFPFRLRQPPGPDNALGRLKFNLQGTEDIYLHDTPQRKAFAKANRALSHGCVRLENPVALAEHLLGANWQGKLPEAIAEAATRTLKMEKSIQVYLHYWTAWADADGTVQFRNDLYGHDARLRAALKKARTQPPLIAQGQQQGAL